MSDSDAIKGLGPATTVPKKEGKAKRAFRLLGFIILMGVLVTMTINAALVVFMPHYYPTYGEYRLFSIITDSMDPTIPAGSMIVDKVLTDDYEVQVGDIITYELDDHNGHIVVLTHRVVEIITDPNNGEESYKTKGDNAGGTDSVHPDRSDIVGVYTGDKVGFFGFFFGFLQSSSGIITLLIIMFIIFLAWVVLAYLRRNERHKAIENAALKKSAQQLSSVSLRYDNVREITAVMDVLGMVTEEPATRKQYREIEVRLGEFVEAESIELPQTPETAAMLDSLPAPDNPTTLAAALRNGATLRQAEDGQTLILTGMSGGKSFMLTPVQTPDGIILCQQGVRLRSDIAPNIESLGAMSMPEYPEFFEGQPLEKNVQYPELPQPEDKKFKPAMLSNHGELEPEQAMSTPALSAPRPVGQAHIAQLGGARPDEMQTARIVAREAEAKTAYAQYRELAAQIELRQVEQLSTLLNETRALTADESDRVTAYRNELKKQKKPRRKLTPEQLAARRATIERNRQEREAFLNALSPSDRELYLSEQKLSKARAATIRRLKRIAADRKLLEHLDK